MDIITQILENVVSCKYFEADVHIKNPIKNSYQDGLGRTTQTLDHVVVVHILIWDKKKSQINEYSVTRSSCWRYMYNKYTDPLRRWARTDEGSKSKLVQHLKPYKKNAWYCSQLLIGIQYSPIWSQSWWSWLMNPESPLPGPRFGKSMGIHYMMLIANKKNDTKIGLIIDVPLLRATSHTSQEPWPWIIVRAQKKASKGRRPNTPPKSCRAP